MAKGTIYNELPFPLRGVNIASGFTHQPKGTVYDAKNVRSFDPTTNANRGAQRCGHSKYLPGVLNGGTMFTSQIGVTGDDGCWNPSSSTFDNSSSVIDLANVTTSGSFSGQINATADDGNWRPALLSFDNSSNSITLNYNSGDANVGFWHFPNVTIPVGATITAATLTIRPQTNESGLTFSIFGDKEANPSAVSSAANGNSRPTTSSAVSWSTTFTSGVDDISPDLSAIIQEIVNQGGWASGNALQLFMKQTSTFSLTTAVGDDGTHPAGRASLSITYSTVSHKWGFWRFPNVTIAPGQTIQSATLTIRPNNTETTTLLINGEKAANPSAVSSASDGDSRARTTASVSWNNAFASGTDAVSLDLSGIIQEIVNQGGWASGNAIQLFARNSATLDGSGSAALNLVGDDGSHPAGRTLLTIVYGSGAASPIQNINHLMSAGTIVPSSGTSFRTLTGVAVAGGTVKTFVRGGSYTATTNGTTALDTTNPYIGSTVLLNKLYYADGVHWKYYDPTTNTVTAMTASAGSLPVDGSGNAPRLIMTWRGRLVYSGLIGDPQNWFMSRQFAPLDWDYSPAITDATMAVAGNNTEAGLIPDLVTTMIPYSDDLAIFGGDHSMWQMTEDPAAGGQIDRISDTVGMAWGDSWCKDAEGNVWFWGSRGGLYVFKPTPGATAAPVRVSAQSVDQDLLDVDMTTNMIRMVWDDRFQAVMIYVTPILGGASTNWVYDVRNEAFWPDSFTNTNHQPTAVHLMDGDSPDDRVSLLGGFDGSIRFIDRTAKDDDGTAISSYVKLGPIQAQGSKLRINELVAVLGESSDSCTLDIYTGHSAEAAFNSATSRFTRTLSAGRSEAIRPATTGQALFLKISNSTLDKAWQFEALFAVLEGLGRQAARQL